jgi:uncharacterized protein YndB with AHSA1/START domain/predicted transcriptional regulator YdeE
MQLTEKPTPITWPKTHYVFVEKIGPFEETAKAAWHECHQHFAEIQKTCQIISMLSLVKIEPQKTYRAGMWISEKPKSLPAGLQYIGFEGGQYEQFVLTGSYSHLPEAWGYVMQKIDNMPVRDDFYIEHYANNPQTTPEQNLRTEIMVPVKSESFSTARVLNAPRDKVFEIWTDPKHLKHWMGPKGFAVEYAKADIRDGGMALSCLTGADGTKMWGKAIYKSIKPSRIEYVQYFSDAEGGTTRHPLSPTWPLEMRTVVEFEDFAERTKVTVIWDPVNPTPEEKHTFDTSHSGMQQGWGRTFERLQEYLADFS